MKRLIIFILLLSAFTVKSYSATFSITISGLTYSPNILTVHVGDQVDISAGSVHPLVQVDKATWMADGATEMSGGWGTKTAKYTFTATAADTIYFVCSVHVSLGMKGKIIVLPGVGVENQTFNNENLKVYPNPVNSIGTLKFENLSPNSILSLYNCSGQKIENFAYNYNGKSLIEFDVNKLDNGSYLIVIINDNKQFVKKFTVSK